MVSDWSQPTYNQQHTILFRQHVMRLYVLHFRHFFENRKNSGLTPGQNDDPVTRWPGRERWPKWPIDPVTHWPSSMSVVHHSLSFVTLDSGGDRDASSAETVVRSRSNASVCRANTVAYTAANSSIARHGALGHEPPPWSLMHVILICNFSSNSKFHNIFSQYFSCYQKHSVA